MSAVTARIRIVLDSVLKSYDIAGKEGRMAYIRFVSIHIIQQVVKRLKIHARGRLCGETAGQPCMRVHMVDLIP
jgi:hypothetical protein